MYLNMFSLRAMDNFTKYILLQVFLILLTLGCEESLPTREQEFIEVIKTEFSTVDGRTSLPFTRDDTWTVRENPPALKISLRFINTSDETLQGYADSIDGYLDIWLKDEPTVGKRLSINKDSEVPIAGTPPRIDNLFLILDPGDTFYMEFHWAHDSEEGVKMWNHFGLQNDQIKQVEVNVLAKLKLFPELPLVTPPILKLELTYYKFEELQDP